jgi:DNA invertase Pin-like site-specific DNA recombinase
MYRAMEVGSYARISYGDDEGLGIARQQHDNSALIRLRGWAEGPQYVDQNVSAYKPDVVRPDFERMLEDLQARRIDGIVVWDLDRLARQPSDLERVIAVYDKVPGLVFATVQGDLQLATSDGRTLARVMCAFANKASADTARRMARKKLERAMAGDAWSNYRAYGWNADRRTINEPEAQILRKAANDVLKGTGIFVICSRLNAQGIRTVRGNIWKTHAMRRVLTAPRIAGFAVYKGEMLTDDAGNPIKGLWEPLLDEATWRAVCVVLTNTRRQQRQRRDTGLLTNIARCGKCGMGLHIARKPNGEWYVCRDTDSGGCAGIGISAPKLEAQVEALLFAYLADREIKTDHSWEGQRRLDEVNHKLSELMEQYRTGMSGSVVFPLLRRLEAERDDLIRQQAEYTRREVRQSATVSDGWQDLDVYAKRAVIQSVIEAVVIKPVGHRGKYDPSRVDVVPLP